MTTPLLKRRLNPFLIASTILVLSLLAGLSVMWQGQLSNLQGEKKNIKSELEQKEQRLANLQAEKSNLSEKLQTTGSSLDQLRSDYSSLETERDQLKKEVSNLEDEVDQKESTITDLENETDSLEENLTEVRTDFRTVCSNDGNNLTDSAETACDIHFNLD
jgi:chromosome segregation ATPase